LCAQSLNGIGDRVLIARKCLPDSSVVIDVLRHHLKDLWKVHQREERGIESLLLSGVGKCGSAEAGILGEPVVNIENFLGIRRCGHNLRKERVGVQGDR